MRKLFFALLICISFAGYAQVLKPGFDGKEYVAILSLFRYNTAKAVAADYGNDQYELLYTSPEVGFKNQWKLYIKNNNVGIIDTRGTVADKVSWLANFYAAMIPASGKIKLNATTEMDYQLANDPKAAVHVGWTVAMLSMAPDMIAKIKEQYQHKNIKDYILFGHSQGGAITYLLSSYLHYLQEKNELPKDIVFKTYCSAAPKPGNINYAYDFDFITRNGWGFNIVNSYDWVPESPYTVQRVQDMNELNPLLHADGLLGKQKGLVKIIAKSYVRKLDRKPKKLQRFYTKTFGDKLYKLAVKKAIKGLEKPDYAPTSNYMRAGTPIVLVPDSTYFKKFPDLGKDYFLHHNFGPYYYLVKKYYP